MAKEQRWEGKSAGGKSLQGGRCLPSKAGARRDQVRSGLDQTGSLDNDWWDSVNNGNQDFKDCCC